MQPTPPTAGSQQQQGHPLVVVDGGSTPRGRQRVPTSLPQPSTTVSGETYAILQSKCERLRSALSVCIESQKTLSERHSFEIQTMRASVAEISVRLQSYDTKIATFATMCREHEPDVYPIVNDMLVKRAKDAEYHKSKDELFEDLRVIRQLRRAREPRSLQRARQPQKESHASPIRSPPSDPLRPTSQGRTAQRGRGGQRDLQALGTSFNLNSRPSAGSPLSRELGTKESFGKSLLRFDSANPDLPLAEFPLPMPSDRPHEETHPGNLHSSVLSGVEDSGEFNLPNYDLSNSSNNISSTPWAGGGGAKGEVLPQGEMKPLPKHLQDIAGMSILAKRGSVVTDYRTAAEMQSLGRPMEGTREELQDIANKSNLAIQMLSQKLHHVSTQLHDAEKDVEIGKRELSASRAREAKLEQALHRSVVNSLKRETTGGAPTSSDSFGSTGYLANVFMTAPPVSAPSIQAQSESERLGSRGSSRSAGRTVPVQGTNFDGLGEASQSSAPNIVTPATLPAVPGSQTILYNTRSSSHARGTRRQQVQQAKELQREATSRQKVGPRGGGAVVSGSGYRPSSPSSRYDSEGDPYFNPDETSAALFRRILTTFATDVAGLLSAAQSESTSSLGRLFNVTSTVCQAVSALEQHQYGTTGSGHFTQQPNSASTQNPGLLSSWMLLQAAGWGEEELQRGQVSVLAPFMISGAGTARGGPSSDSSDDDEQDIATAKGSFYLVDLLNQKPEYQKMAESRKNSMLSCPQEWSGDLELLDQLWQSLVECFRHSVRHVQTQLGQLFGATLRHIEAK